MKHDVLIVGAGIAGLALGLALAQAGRRVQIVDARAPAQSGASVPSGAPSQSGAPAQSGAPSGGGYDQRIYALGPANVAWLESLRLWGAVDPSRVTPVYDMRVLGDAPAGWLREGFPKLPALPRLPRLPGLPGLPHLKGMPGWIGLPVAAGEAGVAVGSGAAGGTVKAAADCAAPAVAEGGVHLSAYQAGLAELCWIVEEREIARVLESAAGFATGLEIIRPVQAQALRQLDGEVELQLADGRTLSAQLLVACDGANSWVRGTAGIGSTLHDYHQTAVVANFRAEKPHHNCAYQWFRREDDGSASVLAWLPLPDGQVSMVWSADDKFAAYLQNLDSDLLAAAAAAAGGNVLGAFTPAGNRAGFKLRNLRAQALIAPRVALAGDAAHVVHPLAGQGLNLGLADARALALALALAGQRDCGARLALRIYERERKAAILEMHAVTHGLMELFSATHPVVRAARNMALNLTGRLPVLPGLMARRAARG
jgi:ubiquinone biosynthesis UbiH/UbiF/VisC/COQ6 family hydroxylase